MSENLKFELDLASETMLLVDAFISLLNEVEGAAITKIVRFGTAAGWPTIHVQVPSESVKALASWFEGEEIDDADVEEFIEVHSV